MGKPPTTPAPKPEPKVRKKPVRKSPALKDYPNKLAWLKAMTQYEEAQSTVSLRAKVVRLDKRIAAKQDAIDDLAKEIAVLVAERETLVPVGLAQSPAEPVVEDGAPLS